MEISARTALNNSHESKGRFIVFFPDKAINYPYSEDIVYEYKVIPAVVVETSYQRIIDWKKTAPGTRIYPDRTYYRSLASLKSVDSTAVDAGSIVGSQPLHSIGLNGSGVRIGVIDTGIYKDHFELTGKVVAEKSFVLTSLGYSTDVIDPSPNHPHGTEVASVAAGWNIGIAPAAELVNAKIFQSGVLGNANEDSEETTSALIAAIDYCVEQGCDIINLSIGQYHNLVDDARGEAIDFVTTNYGVVFCIAAGNEGENPYSRGTLGNPGSAFQAVTVAAYHSIAGEIAVFSGTGPKPDYTMKPDISAPGVSVNCATTSGPGSYTSFSGTSAATPVVAGAAAILIQQLQDRALTYTPGTVKASLLKGAVDILKDGEPLPADQQGAGLLNITNSFGILDEASVIGNEVDLLASLPGKLPFAPFTTLFKGQTLSFNATVASSMTKNVDITIKDIPADFIAIDNSSIVANSTRVPISFTIPETASVGYYSGQIIVESSPAMNTTFDLAFEVKEATHRVLFDEKHVVITYRPYTGTGSWGDTCFLSGMFSSYASGLIARDIAITPFREGTITEELLSGYDALILANPASWVTDKYTDWIDPETLSHTYAAYTEAEYDAIENFVKVEGGGLLVMTLGSETVNITAVNSLVERFGISISNQQSTGYSLITDLITDYSFFTGITGYSHYGTSLSLTAGFVAAYKGQDIVAAGNYYDNSKGRVMVFTTDFPFNDYGFNERYHVGDSNNNLLAVQITEWIFSDSDFDPREVIIPEKSYELNFSLYWLFYLIPAIVIVYSKKRQQI
ncbi:MAG: S8 family peptidase [Candidatus Hodarchaeales archaeon]